MKKYFFLFILSFVCLLAGLVNGCKKDVSPNSPTNIGTATSFTEEFEYFNTLETKGWVTKDNSLLGSAGPYASWTQGLNGADKGGGWLGFTAYSYTTNLDEFAYSSVSFSSTNSFSISSWFITPVLSVKNGDKISFYTRADTIGVHTERMQVLMNKSASADVGGSVSSVGGFSNVLLDINSSQTAGGYPTTWTKYEYTFSGISGKTDTRIGFRHYVTNTTNAKGVGIDQFKFQVN
ncbi:MAG: choice-of-anchor J domain-containing protein [Bacteroidota bacterium]